jgi:hypothetical protein
LPELGPAIEHAVSCAYSFSTFAVSTDGLRNKRAIGGKDIPTSSFLLKEAFAAFG